MENRTRQKLLLLRLGIQCGIALLLSLAITIINHGFAGAFATSWIRGFLVAFLIIPLALRLIPLVAAGARAVLGQRSPFTVRCVVAFCVAVMMEGLIALVVTLVQLGLIPGWPAIWGTTFVKALPVGLFIGFTMTFLVQPRMQRLAASA